MNTKKFNADAGSGPARSRTRLTLPAFLLFLLGFALAPRTVAQSASISTDKADYLPGEYVQVSGVHWQAGETVQLVFTEDPVIHGNDTLYSSAGSSGDFLNADYQIQAHDLGQRFTVTATGLSSGYSAQAYFTDGTDFRQSANNDAGYGTGNVHWINSILQSSNSKYYEGMSSLQRIIFNGIAATSGNVHSLKFTHQSIKNSAGSHAYDFLTSWQQSQDAANMIAEGQGLFANFNPCGPEPSSDPGGILAICNTLHASSFTATPSIPDAMGTTLGDNVATRVAAYESLFGDRTLKIYANAAISGVSVTFNGYTGTDQDANYTLNWTSAASNIVIEFAVHLAAGNDPLLAGIGYGSGKGAGGIPGGPYHVTLTQLDGKSLGSQDNQIKAADVLIPPPCTFSGPSEACLGSGNLVYTGPAGSGFTYVWSFVSANGATFCSSTTSQSVCVTPGSGNFTLRLVVSGSGGSATCDRTITVRPLPSCAINAPANSAGGAAITCGSPGGSPGNTLATSNTTSNNTYLWEILSPPSGWAITAGQGTSQINFTSGVCDTAVVFKLTVTDSNGCTSNCTRTVTPVPFAPPCNANAGPDKVLNCATTTVALQGSSSTDTSTADNGTKHPSAYSWSGPGIVSGGNTLSPVVNAPGDYTLTVTVFPGAGSPAEKSCTDVATVTQNTVTPVCTISGYAPTCTALTNTYTVPAPPAGHSYTYSWTLSGATNASITAGSDAGTVTVTSGSCNAAYMLNVVVTDPANGCSANCSQPFAFADTVAPTITAAGANATINCPDTARFTAPTASDACGAAQVMLVSDTTIGTACNYTRTKTWKAVDACGNESNTVSQSITVHDVTAPVIGTAGGDTTINCPAVPVFTAPGATDECSAVQVVLVADTTIGTSCNYTRTKTWKAVDDCGNASNLISQSITVHDITAPVIGAAGGDTTIDCPAVPVFTAPGATDECSTVQVVLVTDTTIGTGCDYTRTKTWKAVDNCGNASNLVSQSITVHDVTAPVIGAAGANATIDCPAQPTFTAPGATDECSAVRVMLVSDTTIGTACNYTRTRTWKAVDTCGNESNAVSQSITVRDVTNPAIGAAGANATIDCPDQPAFTAPTGNDECGTAQIVLVADTTTGTACNYTRTKTWKAVDDCGNSSNTVSQAVTVRDVTAPTLSGEGADATLEDCGAAVTFTAPTATDACDATPTVNVVRTDTTRNSDGSTTYRRVWNASDDCGNISAEADQAITVPACTFEFCSLTQGFYGNARGVACATGERGDVLIARLLSAPFGNLVIGKSGRSLTIDAAHAACVSKRLPAGGAPGTLPAGNQAFGNNCSTSIPVDKKGKFINVLLGQTITLGLNLRLNAPLGSLIIKGTKLTTIGSYPGADGKCGTDDDQVNTGSVLVKKIPQSVLNALSSLYSSRSVQNLFDLANRALGGLSTGGASLAEINQAVSAINEGFDGCRFLQSFGEYGRDAAEENEAVTDDKNINLKAIPNPFSSSTTLEFTSKADALATVEVYNVEGMKVATLFNENVKANETHYVIFNGEGFADGIYIYRVTTGARSYYHKLLLAK
jgi:hypothetical protein